MPVSRRRGAPAHQGPCSAYVRRPRRGRATERPDSGCTSPALGHPRSSAVGRLRRRGWRRGARGADRGRPRATRRVQLSQARRGRPLPRSPPADPRAGPASPPACSTPGSLGNRGSGESATHSGSAPSEPDSSASGCPVRSVSISVSPLTHPTATSTTGRQQFPALASPAHLGLPQQRGRELAGREQPVTDPVQGGIAGCPARLPSRRMNVNQIWPTVTALT